MVLTFVVADSRFCLSTMATVIFAVGFFAGVAAVHDATIGFAVSATSSTCVSTLVVFCWVCVVGSDGDRALCINICGCIVFPASVGEKCNGSRFNVAARRLCDGFNVPYFRTFE